MFPQPECGTNSIFPRKVDESDLGEEDSSAEACSSLLLWTECCELLELDAPPPRPLICDADGAVQTPLVPPAISNRAACHLALGGLEAAGDTRLEDARRRSVAALPRASGLGAGVELAAS